MVLMNVASNPDAVMEQIRKLERPSKLCGKDVPENLNGMTLGQLCELMDCKDDDIMLNSACIVLGVKPKQVMHERADRVLAFNMYVSHEMARIAELFKSIAVPLTDLQQKAGYGKLNFGPFAILDSYALRMHMTSHKEAEQTPWAIVYNCMKMDAEREMCRRAAEKIQMQEMRSRR